PPSPRLFPYTTLFRSFTCTLAITSPLVWQSWLRRAAWPRQARRLPARSVLQHLRLRTRCGPAECLQPSIRHYLYRYPDELRAARSEEHTPELQSRENV